MICYAQLPIEVSIPAIQAEVALLLASPQWTGHFNKRDYEGNWHVLALRAPGGKASNPVPDLTQGAEYLDTELMPSTPSVRELIDAIKCEKMSVRLLNLAAGSVIKTHRDCELAFEKGEARLHFPVFTNKEVEFYIDGRRVDMKTGDAWYINANLPHRVANLGETDRIHLVVDCKVNPWLEELFRRSEKEEKEELPDINLQNQIIAQFRSQNNTTADQLADQLEREMLTWSSTAGKYKT